MKNVIRWAIDNSPAMNMLMIGILLVGTISLIFMRREVFPEFELEIVLVSVPYPGATPDQVEEGICSKIEEAVRSIEGIKKTTSVAAEGAGSVVLEIRAGEDVQKIVSEVRSEVDRIPSFPDRAEDAKVQQVTMRQPAIKVAVVAPAAGTTASQETASALESEATDSEQHRVDELELREIAEEVRDELLQLPTVSAVNLVGARDYQIDIEIPEETLRKYNLTLQQVAQTVRSENVELPGGTMRGQGREVLLRGKNRRLRGHEIAELPLVTDKGGVVLTVDDLGTVRDEFTDNTAVNLVNRRPALILSVDRTSSEDLLAMTAEVRQYLADKQLPAGYTLETWGDRSTDVRDRLNLLTENGAMGLLLVFLVLAIFLEIRLAFWVALGIPVAMLGAGAILLLGGQTLNMLTMFAFLMALGIVVDDAIVVGENVYAHRQLGKGYIHAAIDGTAEVIPSVVASVATTIVAFCPMLFVSGIMGKYIAVLPFAVIAMLVISLFESTFVLPCHLAHRDNLVFRIIRFFFYPLGFVIRVFGYVNRKTAAMLRGFVDRIYAPFLKWSINNRWTVVAGAVAMLLLTVGFVAHGGVPFVIFPKLDSNSITAKVMFPDGTPAAVTDAATRRMEAALWRVNDQFKGAGSDVVVLAHRSVGHMDRGPNPAAGGAASGSHVGSLDVELANVGERPVTSQDIIDQWRKEVGEIAGAETLSFASNLFGPAEMPIEFKALATSDNTQQLEAVVESCKEKLATYTGVFDITDDSRPGKWEFQIRVKDRAKAMGVSTEDLAETIRSSYYGAEAMRVQRGRHEIKLMVRYPREDRRSLANFQDLYVRTGDGQEMPLTELAEINVVRGYSEINRLDQKRSITVTADLNEEVANASRIVSDLQESFVPDLLDQYPGVQIRWEGQREQTQESLSSLLFGSLVAMLVMMFLLTLAFRSYLQPLLVMAIIPFGFIGAVMGHAVMGLPFTLFSFFGIVALTGVVVNDSIVLIDFINRRVRAGQHINEALLEAGRRRFRPVLLTSMTTVAGLFPILIETSFQAQILIPMATSLSFGLLLATVLVLVLVPSFYRIYHDFVPYKPPAEEEHDEPQRFEGGREPVTAELVTS